MLRRRYDDQRSAYQKRINDEYKNSALLPNAEKALKRELGKVCKTPSDTVAGDALSSMPRAAVAGRDSRPD